MERVVRVLTWLVFGVGFLFAVLLAMLASLTGRPLAAQPGGVRSKVKVAVPQEDATVKINDTPTKTTGTVREYDTPELEPGKRYKYAVTAVWKADPFTVITRTRVVQFNAGEDVSIDLTAGDGTDRLAVELTPLTDDVIDDLVKAAKLTKDDVAVHPAADVRVLIAAVKGGAKKGIAYIPDAEAARAAKAKIAAADLEQKIEVRADEPTAATFADASVVFLHHGPTLTALLGPKVVRDIKAGGRIVSHGFDLGEHKPTEKKAGVNKAGDKYDVLVWTVTDADKKKHAAK